jgi:hypothetical protein
MDREQLAWLAGYLEGEGSFTARPNTAKTGAYRFAVRVATTDLDVAQKAQRILGPDAKLYQMTHVPGIRKTAWTVNVARHLVVESLCLELLPFMGERRQSQIRTVLEALQKFRPTRVKNSSFCVSCREPFSIVKKAFRRARCIECYNASRRKSHSAHL